MKTRLDLIILVTLTALFIIGGYKIGYAVSLNDNQPTSDYFWIDSNRYHKDSLIQCTPIYGEDNEKIGEYIRVTHNETMMYIECLDTEDYTYQDFKSSWLVSFAVGSGDMTQDEALNRVVNK